MKNLKIKIGTVASTLLIICSSIPISALEQTMDEANSLDAVEESLNLNRTEISGSNIEEVEHSKESQTIESSTGSSVDSTVESTYSSEKLSPTESTSNSSEEESFEDTVSTEEVTEVPSTNENVEAVLSINTVMYGTVTANNAIIWSEKIGEVSLGNSDKLMMKTFVVKNVKTIDGVDYYELFSNHSTENEIFIGYIDASAVTISPGKQGIYQSYGKFVTISNNNYQRYNNFNWNSIGRSDAIFNKTFQARGKYEHSNGMTYLSLYDAEGKWYGYINENATKIGNGRQGAYINYGKYISIIKGNYSTYRNFTWTTSGVSTNLMGKTFLAKGKYNHINGMTYLSLYDGNGKWYGYINESATQVAPGKQGMYQTFNKHVIVKSKNYSVYSNFSWTKRQSSANIYNRGLIARGKYNHVNGMTYYSLYDGLGKWQGYINANATTVVSNFVTSTPYYSQFSIGAWNGCAATSLYTVLRAKGYASNVSLYDMVNALPLSNSNPDVGQIGNPWGTTPFKRVISPVGLNKYAQKYTSTSEVISGSSIDRVITEINSGNPVIYWGIYHMGQPGVYIEPQHCMIAIGYKVMNGQEYILIQDPGTNSINDSLARRWVTKSSLDSYLTTKYRKMLVVR